MPCLAADPPTLAIEISVDVNGNEIFSKLAPGVASPIAAYPEIGTSAKLKDVTVDPNGSFSMKYANGNTIYDGCFNIVWFLDPNTSASYELNFENPIDFYPTDDNTNPIDKNNCDHNHGIIWPGKLQIEGETLHTVNFQNVVLSVSYHNHTEIYDTQNIINGAQTKISTPKSFYRVKLIDYPSHGRPHVQKCTDPQIGNGDNNNKFLKVQDLTSVTAR